jgi:diacylglycerol kinase (ATP)
MIGNNYFVVINPNAGKGLGKNDWYQIYDLLRESNINFEYQFSEYEGHIKSIVVERINQNYKNFIIVGGDGSMNEAANAIIGQGKTDAMEIKTGIIPIGTGNDWCRTFNIPFDYNKSIDIIRRGNTIYQDLGLVTYHDESGKKQRYFINIAGMGFDAHVAIKANMDKELNRHSKLLYLKNLLSSLFYYRSVNYRIKFDSDEINLKVYSLSVGKGKYNGGGMKQLPNAIPDDGFLDFTVIGDVKRREVIQCLPGLYKGTHIKHFKIFTYKTRRLEIETEDKVFLEIDGETAGYSPFTFEIIPRIFNVFCNS